MQEDEFNPLITEILSFVNENRFNLYYYPAIYAQLIKLELLKIENFEITNEITDLFKKAIDNGKDNHVFDHSFHIRIPIWDDSDKSKGKEKYKEIYEYAVKANEDVGKNSHQEEIKHFIQMISSNDSNSIEDFMSDYNNRNIFKEINDENLVGKLFSANGATLTAFMNGLFVFYPDNSSFPLSEEEKKCFINLTKEIDDYLSKVEKRPIKSAFLIHINNKAKSILKNGY